MTSLAWPLWIGSGVVGACTVAVGDASSQPADRRNAVYLEVLGNAAAYSVNYERSLVGTWYWRIGAGYLALPENESDEVDGLGLVPVMVGYVTPTPPHHLELSIGIAPVLTVGTWDDVGILGSDTRIVGTGTIGYRFAHPGTRFLFRAGFTPLFGAEGFSPWAGASVGYRF